MDGADAHLVKVGTIDKPHGFQGAFISRASTEKDAAVSYIKSVFIGPNTHTLTEMFVESAQWMPKGWKLKLNGIDSDESVKARRGWVLFVPRTKLKATESNEYYVSDLVGLTVFSSLNGKKVGELSGVEEYGVPGDPVQSTRWWVKTDADSIGVPASSSFIEKVDLTAGEIWVKRWDELSTE